MADWSPDGTKVVFTSGATPGQWIDLDGGAIATMTYNYANGTHTFGDPQYLVQQPITLPHGTFSNFFFPSFSPMVSSSCSTRRARSGARTPRTRPVNA